MSAATPKSRCPITRLCAWMRSVLFYEHWMIGVVDQPIANALHWKITPAVRWLAPFNRSSYLADPFPWPGKENTILAEEFDTATRIGRIVTLTTDAAGITTKTDTSLPATGHMSFPYLFEEEGVIYALPESCATGRLEIFQWDGSAWRIYQTIFNDSPAADAVLTKKDGLFWISYTDVSANPHDNLNLIYAAALTGPWRPHPQNPVQRGAEKSRNGGKIFAASGKLYRPAQDCSRVYGGALRLMEITGWTTSSYAESEAAYIQPSDPFYRDGFHTLVAWGDDQCLVDGMRLVFCWRLLLAKLARRLHIF